MDAYLLGALLLLLTAPASHGMVLLLLLPRSHVVSI